MSGANANKETKHVDVGKEVSVTLPLGPSEPMRQMISASDSDWGAVVFVWGVWALMLLVALLLVGRFGSASVPVNDDWDGIVPALTGAQPFTFEWLWQQHNEHRVLFPRLLLLAVLKPTEDFRAVMFLNVVAMGTVALWMILIAKRLRGRMSYTDAFFSLVLLNLAQFENFLMAWQIQMVTSTVLAAVLLCLIAGRDSLL